MDVSAIRTGLAGVLGGLGYSSYPVLPGSPELPAIVINAPELVEYHQTLQGHSRVTLPISVIVSSSDSDSAQALLNDAVSYKAGALVPLLEAHVSELWSALVVVRSGAQYRFELGNGTTAFGVDLTLTFLA